MNAKIDPDSCIHCKLKAVLCGTASFVVFDSFESAAKPPLVSVAIYQLESAAANSFAACRKVAVT